MTDYPFDNEDFQLTSMQLDCKYNPDGYGEHPWFSRTNWRVAVRNEETLLGYWAWVSHQLLELEAEEEDEEE